MRRVSCGQTLNTYCTRFKPSSSPKLGRYYLSGMELILKIVMTSAGGENVIVCIYCISVTSPSCPGSSMSATGRDLMQC